MTHPERIVSMRPRTAVAPAAGYAAPLIPAVISLFRSLISRCYSAVISPGETAKSAVIQ
jgi:hypothetical protein